MDCGKVVRRNPLTWATFRMLLGQRMLVGIYIGQFCINTLTTFFLTWFPSYLVKARHMSILQAGFAAALPALSRLRGRDSGRRVFGLAAAPGPFADVCAQSADRRGDAAVRHDDRVQLYRTRRVLVMALMSLAFFGKGFGALGWTVIADTSPKELVGVNGGVFNLFGNFSTITTPMVIGFLVNKRRVRSTMRWSLSASRRWWRSSATW